MNVSGSKIITPLNFETSLEQPVENVESTQEKNDSSVKIQIKNSMSEFELRSERYKMSWLSYRTMVADTVEEGIAYDELNSKNCLKYACISRARRAVGFPVLAILGIAHSCFSFLRCMFNFSIACVVCMSVSKSDEGEENNEEDRKDIRNFALSMSCSECYFSCKFCMECTYVALCCLPNACVPEVLDICGQPKVFKKIELEDYMLQC